MTNVLFSVLKILGGSRLEAHPGLDRGARILDGLGLLVLKPVEWLQCEHDLPPHALARRLRRRQRLVDVGLGARGRRCGDEAIEDERKDVPAAVEERAVDDREHLVLARLHDARPQRGVVLAPRLEALAHQPLALSLLHHRLEARKLEELGTNRFQLARRVGLATPALLRRQERLALLALEGLAPLGRRLQVVVAQPGVVRATVADDVG